MKRIGSVLMAAGLGIGLVAAVASIVNVNVDGAPLLQAIGLGRLSFVTAGACLAAGAALRRLGVRKERRAPSPLAQPAEELKPTASPKQFG